MILQSLVAYYEALARNGVVQRPGWAYVRVSYKVILRADGTIRDIVSVKKAEKRGKKEVLVPWEIEAPEQVVRSSGLRANFLCDTAAYLLGYPKGDKKAAQKWETARQLHLQILAGVDSPFAILLRRFFDMHVPENCDDLELSKETAEDLEKGAVLTFTDEYDTYAVCDAAIGNAWDKQYAGDPGAVQGRCLVTGETDEIAILHNKIKGVAGAQAVGANLVGFNAPAFESYGKDGEQGLNAPVGRYAMYAYTTALNHLLGSNETRKQRVRIGDTTVVWWTLDDDREMTELFGAMTFGSLDSSDEPADNDEATIAEVMRKLQNADEIGKLSDRFAKPLCILGISPNAARLSVRFFYRDTFGAFVRNVQAHYDRLAIDKPEYEKPYLPLSELLLETVSKNVRDREKSISALLAGAVYAAIINDWRYPEMLYEQILCRIRAEHTVNARKAAIIKAYLLKNTNMEKEGLGMSLNEECKNQAYVLGRLFAELENAQYQAIYADSGRDKKDSDTQESAKKSSTLRERYLTSACTTPGMVFPSMLQMFTFHIAKLKKDEKKQNVGNAIERQVHALIDMLEGGKPFPVRLNNTEQGLFLEGYYQQVQKNFRTAKENKQNKEEQV